MAVPLPVMACGLRAVTRAVHYYVMFNTYKEHKARHTKPLGHSNHGKNRGSQERLSLFIHCGVSCAIGKTGELNIVFVHGIPMKMRGESESYKFKKWEINAPQSPLVVEWPLKSGQPCENDLLNHSL